METQTPPIVSNQNAVQQQPVHSSNTAMRVIFIIVVALLVLMGLYLFVQHRMMAKSTTYMAPSVTNEPSAMPTTLPAMGTVMLSTMQQQGKVGQPVQVVLKGDSEGREVVGFDILITYDPAVMTVGQVTPLNSSFQISSFTKRKGEISVTGTKVAGGQSASALVNAALLNIAFTPLKTGASLVDLKAAIGNERTKFVDGKNVKYSPKLESLSLNVL